MDILVAVAGFAVGLAAIGLLVGLGYFAGVLITKALDSRRK